MNMVDDDSTGSERDQLLMNQQQQQESIFVKFKLDKRNYQPGSHIHGSIYYFVPLSADGCDCFSAINLSLRGQESVELALNDIYHGYGITDESLVDRYHEDIAELDTEVLPLPAPLVAGQYEYPFCLKLPESLPCSMRCRATDESTCQIAYTLRTYLSTATTTEGPKFSVINHRQLIRITAGNGISCCTGSADTTVEPKRFTIRSWLKNKGCVEIGMDTDEIRESANSTIAVGITGRNLSSVPVKELVVKWNEIVSWGLPGEEREIKKVVAETTLLVNDLPSWQQTTKGNRNNAAVADRLIAELDLKNARDSYIGRMIQVKHTLQVSVVTEGKRVTRPKSIAFMELRRQGEDNKPVPVMVQAQVVQRDGANNNNLSSGTMMQSCGIPLDIEIPEAVAVAMNDSILCQVEEQSERGFSSPVTSGEFSVEPIHVMTIE